MGQRDSERKSRGHQLDFRLLAGPNVRLRAEAEVKRREESGPVFGRLIRLSVAIWAERAFADKGQGRKVG